jgi:hypothetical protein
MFKKSLLTIATLALVSTGAIAAENMEVKYKDKVWKTVVATDSMSDSSYCKVTSVRRKHITANPSMVYVNTKTNGIVSYQIRLDSNPALPKQTSTVLERDTGFIMIPSTTYMGKNRMRIVGTSVKGKSIFEDVDLQSLNMATKACL